MKKIFAKILGNHAAEVIKRTSDLCPTGITVTGQPTAPPEVELAVRIDFKGILADKTPVDGYVLCGSVRHDQSRPLLAAMARHFGLGEALADSPQGAADILSEFLNIIIGLTGADWGEHGFEMDFSTPRNVSGQAPAQFTGTERAFHIAVTIDGGADVDLVAVFNG